MKNRNLYYSYNSHVIRILVSLFMNIKKYNIRAKKSLGQNFLTDSNILDKIIKAANLKPDDIVLEIGPGLGFLTKELAKQVKKVIAIEKDDKLCAVLKDELKDYNNIKIINADAIDYKPQTINYKIIANLPFYIASAVIRKFLETENKPKEMILMVQKEVAQRITASPPNMSILSVSVQVYSKPKILFYISKKSFSPQPKVDAAMLKICLRPGFKQKIDMDLFFKIVKAGFSSPRKQLINNLSYGLKMGKEKTAEWLQKNNIDPTQRAETLTIDNWLDLTKVI